MVESNLPAWIQAIGAVVVALGGLWGFYHRIIIKPISNDAGDAMSRADDAHQLAARNKRRVDGLEDDLGASLDALSESVDGMREELERQRRQSRGTSYQLYVLAEAINESDEAPDVPVPDEDDFLRGGGD